MEELRRKIRKTHGGRADKLNRPVYVHESFNVCVGLKCHAKDGSYHQKKGMSFSKVFSRTATFHDVLVAAKSHFGISSKKTGVLLGTYSDKKSIRLRDTIERYANSQKGQKSNIRVYVYYPNTYAHLELNRLKGQGDADSDEEDEESGREEGLEDRSGFRSGNGDGDGMEVDEGLGDGGSLQITSSGRIICPVCSRTYVGSECLLCQQDTEFQDVLKNDSQSLSLDAVRQARVARLAPVPVRYRVSIGEDEEQFNPPSAHEDAIVPGDIGEAVPVGRQEGTVAPMETTGDVRDASLLNNPTTTATKEIPYGEEEVERFLEAESMLSNDSEETERDITVQIDEMLQERFIREASQNVVEKTSTKTIIVQRARDRFWPILFKQKFDLKSQHIRVRFAGEPAADAGGPLREFLHLCMKNFKECGLVMGEKAIFLSCKSQSLVERMYHKLGQLTGLAILTLGRGPECLHPAVVRAIFCIEQPVQIEEVDDGALLKVLEEINIGKYDTLLTKDINVNGRSKDEIKKMFLVTELVFSKHAAISQFKDGLRSVSSNLVDSSNYEVMKSYLEENDRLLTFDSLMEIIDYPQLQSTEEGSNAHFQIKDAVGEFEMFLTAVEAGELSIDGTLLNLGDFLVFCTGTDRIPPFGFATKLEVIFEDRTLPKGHTCGLTLSVPLLNMQERFVTAFKFGGGFSDI